MGYQPPPGQYSIEFEKSNLPPYRVDRVKYAYTVKFAGHVGTAQNYEYLNSISNEKNLEYDELLDIFEKQQQEKFELLKRTFKRMPLLKEYNKIQVQQEQEKSYPAHLNLYNKEKLSGELFLDQTQWYNFEGEQKKKIEKMYRDHYRVKAGLKAGLK